MSSLRKRRSDKTRDERGTSLVEYALLVALIAVVCISAMAYFGSATATRMSRNASSLAGAGS
jgi:pilus assembly protein Flp/PilA